MAKERAINNAKWESSLSGRMASDDVCIDVDNFEQKGCELKFEFDAQEQAIIILDEKQKQQLIKKLLEDKFGDPI